MSFFSYLKQSFPVPESRFTRFFGIVFITTLIAYAPSILPFLPSTFFGFNWPGIAWILMFLVTLGFLVKNLKSSFPFWIWLPWFLYLLGSVALDFSFVGLQLTLQYILPILIGIVAGSFTYSWTKLNWLFQNFLKVIGVVYSLFLFYKILFGFPPHMAATPMLLYVMATLSLGIYFFTKSKKFLILFFLLFLMPFVSVTRMALLVFGVSFILHFANKRIRTKVFYSFLGGVLMLIVVNSRGFQEKTFYSGSGDISEISLDYYENDELNSSGRKSWQIALEPGLNAAPIWGNGPRADAPVLGAVIGKEVGEAHNDYLSVRYNYGWVGLSLLLMGNGITFFILFKMSYTFKDPVFQFLALSTMTLFLGFLLFMYSDNILKYTIWFPNYFFALIGICFSMCKKGFSYN